MANNFGNLCQRVFSFIEKNCNSKIPSPDKFNDRDRELLDDTIKKLPKLKMIATCGVGLDNIDLVAAKKSNILESGVV